MLTKLILAAALGAAPAIAFASDDHSGHDHGSHAMEMSDDKAETAMMMAGDAPMLMDAYARAASPNARAGAAFGMIMNPTEMDDTLIEVRADVSQRVELHTHIKGDDGVMMMREVEGGFAVPAGGSHMLARGGDHIMFMGLTESFTQGMEIPVTLVFENAGEVATVITVDLERVEEGMHGGHGEHSGHNHGEATN
ncbi:MAG: copper chaperone PCu(A)C [Pseudomonadota bacterium]